MALSKRAASIRRLTGSYRVKLLNGREIDAMPIYQMYHDAPPRLRSGYRRTRSPGPQGPPGPMGARFRHD